MIDPHGIRVGRSRRIIETCTAVIDGVATLEQVTELAGLVRTISIPNLRSNEQQTAFIGRVHAGNISTEDRMTLRRIIQDEGAYIRTEQHNQKLERARGVRY